MAILQKSCFPRLKIHLNGESQLNQVWNNHPIHQLSGLILFQLKSRKEEQIILDLIKPWMNWNAINLKKMKIPSLETDSWGMKFSQNAVFSSRSCVKSNPCQSKVKSAIFVCFAVWRCPLMIAKTGLVDATHTCRFLQQDYFCKEVGWTQVNFFHSLNPSL